MCVRRHSRGTQSSAIHKGAASPSGSLGGCEFQGEYCSVKLIEQYMEEIWSLNVLQFMHVVRLLRAKFDLGKGQ